ncbi:MAG: DNA-binding protein [Ferruginibacter sp.]|nr:DNA-binding protein [Ferruginibacter sp.]
MFTKVKIVLLSFALTGFLLQGCSAKIQPPMQPVQTFAIRLKPGEDLKKSLLAFVKEKQLKAAWIVTCVGSLTQYNIRFANQSDGVKGTGHFEIVGLTGTLSLNGAHVHIAVSESTGKTTGGHLLDGNIIFTTAEIVIQNDPSIVFTREKDGSTEWEELQIRKAN